jgi:hypothetical protein
MCAAGLIERQFPPAYFWTAIVAAWFLGLSLLAEEFRAKRGAATPSVWGALTWLGLALFAGAAMLGPWAALPFGVWCFKSWNSLTRLNAQRERRRFLQAIRALSAAALAGLAATYFFAQWQFAQWTPVDKILRWGETPAGLIEKSALLEQNPFPLAEMREILDRAAISQDQPELVWRWAVEMLSEKGDPDQELPFLRVLRRRVEATPPSNGLILGRLQEAIRLLEARQAAYRRTAERVSSDEPQQLESIQAPEGLE